MPPYRLGPMDSLLLSGALARLAERGVSLQPGARLAGRVTRIIGGFSEVQLAGEPVLARVDVPVFAGQRALFEVLALEQSRLHLRLIQPGQGAESVRNPLSATSPDEISKSSQVPGSPSPTSHRHQLLLPATELAAQIEGALALPAEQAHNLLWSTKSGWPLPPASRLIALLATLTTRLAGSPDQQLLLLRALLGPVTPSALGAALGLQRPLARKASGEAVLTLDRPETTPRLPGLLWLLDKASEALQAVDEPTPEIIQKVAQQLEAQTETSSQASAKLALETALVERTLLASADPSLALAQQLASLDQGGERLSHVELQGLLAEITVELTEAHNLLLLGSPRELPTPKGQLVVAWLPPMETFGVEAPPLQLTYEQVPQEEESALLERCHFTLWLPRLGEVEATLLRSEGQLLVRLDTGEVHARATLLGAASDLAKALSSFGECRVVISSPSPPSEGSGEGYFDATI